MKHKIIKEILTITVFIGVLGSLSLLFPVMPKPDMLLSERRTPARFPDFSMESIASSSFSGKFEDWVADNFAFRDTFRTVNAYFVFNIYRQSDKAGLYRSDDAGLGRITYISDETLEEAARKIAGISEIFEGLDMSLYYSIIPDKSMYTQSFRHGFDARRAQSVLSQALPGFTYIDITPALSADSYYKTDLHWDQLKLKDTAEMLAGSMGAQHGFSDQSGSIVWAGEFRGVYAGQYALPYPPDMMAYSAFQGLKISYLDGRTLEMTEGVMYDTDRFYGIDPYDIFLQGPQPLVVIENEKAPGRELYVFRDSFGSSIAPLLAGAYSRIILVDLRYVRSSMLERHISFLPGSDVLFIYSSQILGNPGIIS